MILPCHPDFLCDLRLYPYIVFYLSVSINLKNQLNVVILTYSGNLPKPLQVFKFSKVIVEV